MKNPLVLPPSLLCGECGYVMQADQPHHSRHNIFHEEGVRFVRMRCLTMACSQRGVGFRFNLPHAEPTEIETDGN